jgi:hypothetical protein
VPSAGPPSSVHRTGIPHRVALARHSPASATPLCCASVLRHQAGLHSGRAHLRRGGDTSSTTYRPRLWSRLETAVSTIIEAAKARPASLTSGDSHLFNCRRQLSQHQHWTDRFHIGFCLNRNVRRRLLVSRRWPVLSGGACVCCNEANVFK